MPLPPLPQPPPAASQFSRISITDLKSQITKQLGPIQAQRYFGYLNEFLLQKLTKVAFDTFCVKTLGRENLPLHNQLIRSILRNAFQAKVPPLVNQERGVPRSGGVFSKKTSQLENAFNSPQTDKPAPQIFSNGDLLPPSSRKIRSGTQNRRIKDCSSPLAPDNKVMVASRQPFEEAIAKENGDLSLYNSKRDSQHQQSLSEEQLAKKPRIESFHNCDPLHSKGVGVVSLKDRNHLEHIYSLDSAKGAFQAPVGIPCFSASIGGARRHPHITVGCSSDRFSRSCNSDELCDTDVLKKRMEKLAEAQGLEGVTLDCANLLNSGLDVYLKQLIGSFVNLAGARTGHDRTRQSVSKPQSYIKPINGVLVDNHIQAQTSSGVSASPIEQNSNISITMQDFKVAMQLKPQQLGEDWPLLMEKICVRSFED